LFHEPLLDEEEDQLETEEDYQLANEVEVGEEDQLVNGVEAVVDFVPLLLDRLLTPVDRVLVKFVPE
jgi:hypothetical protein